MQERERFFYPKKGTEVYLADRTVTSEVWGRGLLAISRLVVLFVNFFFGMMLRSWTVRNWTAQSFGDFLGSHFNVVQLHEFWQCPKDGFSIAARIIKSWSRPSFIDSELTWVPLDQHKDFPPAKGTSTSPNSEKIRQTSISPEFPATCTANRFLSWSDLGSRVNWIIHLTQKSKSLIEAKNEWKFGVWKANNALGVRTVRACGELSQKSLWLQPHGRSLFGSKVKNGYCLLSTDCSTSPVSTPSRWFLECCFSWDKAPASWDIPRSPISWRFCWHWNEGNSRTLTKNSDSFFLLYYATIYTI